MSSGTPDQGDLLPEDRTSLSEILARLAHGPHAFRDESLAPEVDRDLLLALVRRQLSEEEARLVYRLIYAFESWSDAHTQMLVDEFHSRQQDG